MRPRTLVVVVVSKKESLLSLFNLLLGHLYVRINGIQMIMKLLHVIVLVYAKPNVAIFIFLYL